MMISARSFPEQRLPVRPSEAVRTNPIVRRNSTRLLYSASSAARVLLRLGSSSLRRADRARIGARGMRSRLYGGRSRSARPSSGSRCIRATSSPSISATCAALSPPASRSRAAERPRRAQARHTSKGCSAHHSQAFGICSQLLLLLTVAPRPPDEQPCGPFLDVGARAALPPCDFAGRGTASSLWSVLLIGYAGLRTSMYGAGDDPVGSCRCAAWHRSL